MIKVLHLITELSSGGAQSLLLRQLAHTDLARFPTTVICFYNGTGLVAERIRQLGVAVIDLQLSRKTFLRALPRLYGLIRQEQPTILHTWLFHANLTGRLIGRLAGTPAIITSRHNVEIGSQWREQLLRYTNGLDQRIIAVCEAARQAEITYAGADPAKVVTIYNGVDTERFTLPTVEQKARVRQTLKLAPDEVVIGTVGRMHPQKGLPHLLQAFANLHAEFGQVRLLLVGDGELRPMLTAAVQKLGLTEYVLFTGERADVPELLGAIDLYALPSLWEGLPVAVLEAMATGLPVVATAVGGTTEVVVNGVTGLLVPPGDEAALTAALRQLLQQPERQRQMGQAGRRRIEQEFTLAQMLQQTTALYSALAARHQTN